MTLLNTNAFAQITSLETLTQAHRKALIGKRSSQSATATNYRYMSDLLKIQQELMTGTYKPMPYRKRIITEPKVRIIEAPAFRDRIVHHAIHSVLNKFYEKHFIRDSYACRPNKGIHKATTRVQHFLRSEPNLFVCKIDISKYYGSVNHNKLHTLLAKRITDTHLLKLLDVIIASSDSSDEYNHLFPPDSHFHTKGRRGIPIGNLTSQLFANIYLHELDMFAKQTLHIKFYARYMDDILFFHTDKAQLHKWQTKITKFLYDSLYLTVNPKKVRIYPSSIGVDFVGYVMYPKVKRVRSASVRRFRHKFRRYLRGYLNGNVSEARIEDMFNAWSAHARHGQAEPIIEQLREKKEEHQFIFYVMKKHRANLRRVRKPTQISLFDDYP